MLVVWVLLSATVSVLFSAAVTWLIADRRFHAQRSRQQAELLVAGERVGDARAATDKAQSELAALRAAMATLQQERATLVAEVAAERQNVAQQRTLLDDARARLRESFAELSVEALRRNSAQFFEAAEQRFGALQSQAVGSLGQKTAEMQQILNPITAVLQQYGEKLDHLEKTRGDAYTGISQQLAAVAATQQNLSRETTQLVSALRKPQGRGRWGELTLKRLFEMAGMAERVTFTEQVSVATDDGRRRPDCVVELPGQRQVIVDSKCVIDAFLDAAACSEDIDRAACMARHAQQVRARVNDLASKAYWELFDKATDYVVLFLPGEAFLYAAVEQDPSLIEDALNQRVIVASPTTLLGLLRVIEHGWRSARVQENADAIRHAATGLLDRLSVLTDHFGKLGIALGNASEAYNRTLGSLERNVFTQAKRMRDLGVAGTKPPRQASPVDDTVRPLNDASWAALPARGTGEEAVDAVDAPLANLALP
ncbi:MAG TPA: DNA recombination protein RmuC [Tepidisphaeraceae bacterium]